MTEGILIISISIFIFIFLDIGLILIGLTSPIIYGLVGTLSIYIGYKFSWVLLNIISQIYSFDDDETNQWQPLYYFLGIFSLYMNFKLGLGYILNRLLNDLPYFDSNYILIAAFKSFVIASLFYVHKIKNDS